ncbi:hypothetical protein AB4156_31300 [Cupriavidus sp. 2MCAB6]|uniref:hypothetical protein n=1 Tax=Cupriavidus sp. 2MCAB6 TaxID=3232981 RepID=UPI003F8F2060
MVVAIAFDDEGRCDCEDAMSAVILESVLTCPHCGFAKQETMPTDACQFSRSAGKLDYALPPCHDFVL